eukprot:gene460-242_t
MSAEEATGLEAARKQKIHNLKLKTGCLENEELIQELHISDWSETQRQKLRGAHDKAQELLAAVEVGTKWNLMEAYDLAKLMPVPPEDKPQFMDVIAMKKVLQDQRQNRNKTRVVSFTQLIDNSIAKVEKVEEELRRSQLDATQLAQVPTRTLKMMEDIMNATQIQNALASTDDQMKVQLAQLEKTNEIQNVAMHDGEMQVAEEQMWTKVQLQERLIELLKDKFGLIGKCEEENSQFKEIYEVQKQANQETSQMKDAQRRLKQRCETDLKHIEDAIQKADLEDAEATKRYAANKEASERFVKENEDQQEDCWNKIQDLERQLQKLGTDRFDEVKRRIEEIDREEKRRVENAQFLEIASQHKKLLELTVYNCDIGLRCTGLIEEMVAEGCAGVKARYDKTNQELAALRLEVHKEHLEYFRMLYLTLGSLIYKKEKRLEEIDRNIRTTHIQLEFCVETFDPNAKKHADMKKELYKLRQGVEEELGMLKEKQANALDDFKESEEALDAAGIEFNHPVDENNEEVLTRRSKMVEYKSHITKQEEVKIAAEREEIKRARLLRTGGDPQIAGDAPLRSSLAANGLGIRVRRDVDRTFNFYSFLLTLNGDGVAFSCWTFSVHVSAVGIALDALPRSKLVHRRPDCYVGRTRASAVGKETVDRERKQRPGNLLRSQWTHTEGLSAGLLCPPPPSPSSLLFAFSLATAQMYFVGCSSCRQCIILFSSLYPSTTHIIEKTNGRFTIISFFSFLCVTEDSVPRYLRMHSRRVGLPDKAAHCLCALPSLTVFNCQPSAGSSLHISFPPSPLSPLLIHCTDRETLRCVTPLVNITPTF